jgi:hypothetical protein
MKPLRKVSLSDLSLIASAQKSNAETYHFLQCAGAEKAAASCRAFAKSILGAYRHAQRCYETENRVGRVGELSQERKRGA